MTRILAVIFLIAGSGYGQILDTRAAIRPDNSLIADVQVTAAGNVAQVQISYEAAGVDALVTPPAPVSSSGRAIVTIGRLRANTTYTYTVSGSDNSAVTGSFTTGPLPLPLAISVFTLTGRTTVPLIVLPLLLTGAADFRGYIALDLHSADSPQIVWYYSNAPSTASGIFQADPVGSITLEPNGNFLFADAGSGPPPLAADAFIREIAPDGSLLTESPADCSVTPAAGSVPAGWIWGQGNDIPEQLLPGAGGIPGTVLHLGKIVRDPFFDAGLAPQGKRLQVGSSIRRWDQLAGVDEIVWDPFAFLDPLTERTDAMNSDPGANSGSAAPMACAGAVLLAEDWMHANSLQLTPSGAILMSIRHLDTVISISPQFDGIQWRIGGPRSDFAFPNPADRFYHQHFVRMLDNGNLLLMDNGNSRPSSEGGLYSRALELALDWDSMTAAEVWEYRHPVAGGAYKYADKVGSAERLANGNTLVLFGADVDPATLAVKDPQTFTLVESGPDAVSIAVLDMQMPGNFPIYRALPLNTLFGEAAITRE